MKSLLLCCILSLIVFAQATTIQSLRSQIREVPTDLQMVAPEIVDNLAATSQATTEMGDSATAAPSTPAPSAPAPSADSGSAASGDSASAASAASGDSASAASAASGDSASAASAASGDSAAAPSGDSASAASGDSAAAPSGSASGSASSESAGKGTVQHVPMTQRVVVGEKGKNYSPILFNERYQHNFPADGLIKAAKVPRSDGIPIKPIVKHKDGTFTDSTLQPVTPPTANPNQLVFLELQEKRVDREQIETAAKALAESVLNEVQIQHRQKEITEQNELKDALNNIRTTFDGVVDEVDAFNTRAREEYSHHKNVMV